MVPCRRPSPDTGPSVLVIANGDAQKARDAAQRVARFVWERRDEFRPNAPARDGNRVRVK
ncbi:M81 family metallopeptidase [Phyllobacterium zundukense]|uniref:M81 family metallopeptidase n=1 Tax=Phyllobacterium zundukense TaxID=1867719 RepID=UPI003965AE5C